MTVRLTMLEERKVALAVAALTFAAMLQSKSSPHEQLLGQGFKLMADALWEEVFGIDFATMTLRNFPEPGELGASLQASVDQYYPGPGR